MQVKMNIHAVSHGHAYTYNTACDLFRCLFKERFAPLIKVDLIMTAVDVIFMGKLFNLNNALQSIIQRGPMVCAEPLRAQHKARF